MGSFAFGIGVGTQNSQGAWLEVFYRQPLVNPSDALVAAAQSIIPELTGNSAVAINAQQAAELATALADDAAQASVAQALANSQQPAVVTLLSEDSAPDSVPAGYLKLHLLSHRLVKPHGTVLDGLFGALPNVAWTNQGAIDPAELADRQYQARLNGQVIEVMSVDKFPKMTNYVVPTGVRVAHTARVRLGAYLGEGTTIMHEGFVNFNAGTIGPNMIEGRISAGVIVGAGSDVGGGASTMGTLSGGNSVVISLGDNCLLGANAGTGIPLGDRCTIEAGLYITGGTIVTLVDENRQAVRNVKARELAGQSDMLFRRNSQTGGVECLTNSAVIELNEELHAHN